MNKKTTPSISNAKVPSVEMTDKTNGSVLRITAYETSGTIAIDDKVVTVTQEDVVALISDLNVQIQEYNKLKKKIKKKDKVTVKKVKEGVKENGNK